jgi:sulfur-carrier protein
MIRVVIPVHLRSLAKANREEVLQVEGEVTINKVLDALESKYPMLRGTIRDYTNLERRPFIRFFACGQDLSLEPNDIPLPAAIASGKEPLYVVGAMAGG